MSTNRTVAQKTADTLVAYEALRAELTPVQMRELITKMTSQTPGEGDDIAAYTSLVQASLHLARVVAANDRTAMLAAAMLAQSGVARPVFNPDEE